MSKSPAHRRIVMVAWRDGTATAFISTPLRGRLAPKHAVEQASEDAADLGVVDHVLSYTYVKTVEENDT